MEMILQVEKSPATPAAKARASHSKFIAFRQNRLTQLLRGCFLPGRWRGTGYNWILWNWVSTSTYKVLVFK
jgi:hypothetical protein